MISFMGVIMVLVGTATVWHPEGASRANRPIGPAFLRRHFGGDRWQVEPWLARVAGLVAIMMGLAVLAFASGWL